MPTLIFRFPGRRYHATPWGHHVNEGQIEWPPSPWRLLRALIATGYATLQWPGDGPPPVARSLIEKLAGVLPRYRLPSAVGTHSRHYMPLAKFKNGREDTTLVFDTWAQVDNGALSVTWDVKLSDGETLLLSELAERLGYLGRSESAPQAGRCVTRRGHVAFNGNSQRQQSRAAPRYSHTTPGGTAPSRTRQSRMSERQRPGQGIDRPR